MAGSTEFTLIERHLTGLGAPRDAVVLGVGDDAAILRCPPGQWLLSALDTLVEDVHFPADLPAEAVGYRALAVNLSDIAAMGGQAHWALVGLTLPAMDEDWVAGFARGLDALARDHGVAIVGGDVTRGPLTISVQITGDAQTPPLRRDGALVGDDVWVSGRLGEAAGGLAVWQAGRQAEARWAGLVEAFVRPRPRLALGQALVGIAHAAIDVSDGLLADAGHIAHRSGVAIELDSRALRPSARLRAWAGEHGADRCLRGGGDDYELCFTAPAAARADVQAAARAVGTPVRRIGEVRPGEGIRIDGQVPADGAGGYRHFQD